VSRIYCVFKEGIYNQGFYGTFDTQEKAIEQADKIAAEDRDDYHRYEVVSFGLNDPDSFGDWHYEVRRSEALSKIERGGA
jgi:hypothetical protein